MEPMDNWRSALGRIMLIGDAAHPVLPTTGQGLSQGIMDGAVLAICLELAGKDNVRLGLQAMEMMRLVALRFQIMQATTWLETTDPS
jgi:2-polyprenyl-6-methoxyphenol hydroxylase and related FAD-dependent oxidoreductases